MKAIFAIQFLLLIHLIFTQSIDEEPFYPFTKPNYFPRTTSFPSDYITAPINMSQSNEAPIFEHHKFNVKLPNRPTNITGNVFVIHNPFKHFSVFPSPKGCPGKAKTSETSKLNNCIIGVNAGFFNWDGTCIGHVISNAKIVQITQTKGSYFGIREDGKYAIGYINGTVAQSSPKYLQLVMGIIWLIRDGKEWVNQSRDIEGVDQSWINAKAPRIAIGYNKFGHLVIYHNNGYHTGEPGADLYEVVQILRKFDIVNAVNLDGGGSTSVVLKNVVINRCSDKCQPNDLPNRCPSTEDRCERLVTTICCIANRK